MTAQPFVVVVTWQDPEPGVFVYGPFGTDVAAELEVDFVREAQLEALGVDDLPEDVVIEVQPLVAI